MRAAVVCLLSSKAVAFDGMIRIDEEVPTLTQLAPSDKPTFNGQDGLALSALVSAM